MIFPRHDFFEYFESGQTWCQEDGSNAAVCRPNPCMTSETEQNDGNVYVTAKP